MTGLEFLAAVIVPGVLLWRLDLAITAFRARPYRQPRTPFLSNPRNPRRPQGLPYR